MCFAMDRDAHACTRLEVHEVYMHLPSYKGTGTIVEQPDGGYVYGAQQQPPPAAPAPYSAPYGAPAPYGTPYGQPGMQPGMQQQQQQYNPPVVYPNIPRV